MVITLYCTAIHVYRQIGYGSKWVFLVKTLKYVLVTCLLKLSFKHLLFWKENIFLYCLIFWFLVKYQNRELNIKQSNITGKN